MSWILVLWGVVVIVVFRALFPNKLMLASAFMTCARAGSVCTGTGFRDTQTCVECANGGVKYQCAEGFVPTGDTCSGTRDSDSQTCEPLAENTATSSVFLLSFSAVLAVLASGLYLLHRKKYKKATPAVLFVTVMTIVDFTSDISFIFSLSLEASSSKRL